jgi:hypothetical protein
VPGAGAENFFQSLENGRKFFPIIGKIRPVFPTNGKLFSNHWKIRAVFPTIGKKVSNRWKTRGGPAGRRIVRTPVRGAE